MHETRERPSIAQRGSTRGWERGGRFYGRRVRVPSSPPGRRRHVCPCDSNALRQKCPPARACAAQKRRGTVRGASGCGERWRRKHIAPVLRAPDTSELRLRVGGGGSSAVKLANKVGELGAIHRRVEGGEGRSRANEGSQYACARHRSGTPRRTVPCPCSECAPSRVWGTRAPAIHKPNREQLSECTGKKNQARARNKRACRFLFLRQFI